MSGLQPSQWGGNLFPNASHWAELLRPFRALSAISNQRSVFSNQDRTANKSTNQQLNISTIQQLTASAGFTRAESPFYFSPIPQGWGIDSPILFFEGCKPELSCWSSAVVIRNFGIVNLVWSSVFLEL